MGLLLASRCCAVEFVIGVRMTEFSFPSVSVDSSGGEYFQVSFEDDPDSDSAYFLIQRQFESYDGGLLYLESHQRTLCGHFKIRRAAWKKHVSSRIGVRASRNGSNLVSGR